MSSFRKFIEEDGTAAPFMGDNPAPSSPDNKKYDVSVGDREFGISPDERKTIDLHGEFIMSYQPLTIPGHNVIASAPIPLQIMKKFPDGSAKVKVMYSMTNPEKLMNLNRTKHQGPVEDQVTYLSKKQLDKIQLSPFGMAGAGMGGGMMGGMGSPMPGAVPGTPGGI